MSRQIFILGQRYWDAQTGSLYSELVEGVPDENTRVKLTNKQQLLLKALLEAHPKILSYEELTHKVWLGRVMSPESLPQLVNRTRTALGDKDKAIIVNVPNQGYMLKFEKWQQADPAAKIHRQAAGFRAITPNRRFRGIVVCLLIVITGWNAHQLYKNFESERLFLKAMSSTPYPNVIKDETGQVTAINIGEYRCDYHKAQRRLKCDF